MPGSDHPLWRPPDFTGSGSNRIFAIGSAFEALFPADGFGHLAGEISGYWISALQSAWEAKPESLRIRDLAYSRGNPLSRIGQRAVVIAYADMVRQQGQPTLQTLRDFLRRWFPAIGGLHILPACEINEQRFNDGGFSQIRRDRIHGPYGTNGLFVSLTEDFFSMTDFVLNHVDIEHPRFKAYLAGDDPSGKCFYIFSEEEYQLRKARGDFDAIFRPRPFPLFTVFRRDPLDRTSGKLPGWRLLNEVLQGRGLLPLPGIICRILEIFPKIRTDQMLLQGDASVVEEFRGWLQRESPGKFETLFTVSTTQETPHVPYTFRKTVASPGDFLAAILPAADLAADAAPAYAGVVKEFDSEIFGEPVRVLTTFSHVQVDLNTSTLEGLKLLADDFSWYLKMDLNMLRLDAANFAFKKWGTSCFGLPEVNKLLEILYISMDCVAPRMVPNLEVNAPLSVVLSQMEKSRPPMMYDFHLAAMLPAVFNAEDPRPLKEIGKMIAAYEIPKTCIRFSLDESHDGKSVSGSGGADPLLTYEMRRSLMETVEKNGGKIKYKSAPVRCCPAAEFSKICSETGLDAKRAAAALFDPEPNATGLLKMKNALRSVAQAAAALDVPEESMHHDAALAFLTDKLFHGREPYELCTSTWDAMKRLEDPALAAQRYMALKTLALALMGRHVKSVYFNDLMALPNDTALLEATGELRNIKRTRSSADALAGQLEDPTCHRGWISRQMNNLIALADADPALGPEGDEAGVMIPEASAAVAVIHNHCMGDHTLVVIHTGRTPVTIRLDISCLALVNGKNTGVADLITGNPLPGAGSHAHVDVSLHPFHRLWLKNRRLSLHAMLPVSAFPGRHSCH